MAVKYWYTHWFANPLVDNCDGDGGGGCGGYCNYFIYRWVFVFYSESITRGLSAFLGADFHTIQINQNKRSFWIFLAVKFVQHVISDYRTYRISSAHFLVIYGRFEMESSTSSCMFEILTTHKRKRTFSIVPLWKCSIYFSCTYINGPHTNPYHIAIYKC